VTGDVCGCLVEALVEQAPKRSTRPGCCFHCAGHGQMIVWDGYRWRWSNQPEDIGQLPLMADCRDSGPVPN
jgi:hypothetical protein